MKGMLAALVLTSMLLIGVAAGPRVQLFMDRTPPGPVIQSGDPAHRPPTVDCRTGRRNPMRPPSWSLGQEALVQSAVLRRFLDEVYASPPPGDVEILIGTETARQLLPPGTDELPMNWICEQWPQLQVSTAESFRRFNRNQGEPGFRLVSSIVPVRYVQTPRSLQDWQTLLRPRGGVGLLNISHVGFSEGMTQALVAVDQHVHPGYGQGFFFLLERTAEGWWRIVAELPTWVT